MTLTVPMSLADPLPIPPFTRPARGDVIVPGSKSITNRALLLAALCDGPVTLTGALFSEDTRIMAEALRRLGFEIEPNAARKTFDVTGLGGVIPAKEATLDVGLSGTAARFLTALCAAAPGGTYRLDGVAQMRRRPMKGLIDALRSLGADIRCTGAEGHLPLEVHARGLNGGEVVIDAGESSQMLSALIMVAPLAKEQVKIVIEGSVRRAFVNLTLAFAASFGGLATTGSVDDRPILPPHGRYRAPTTYAVEPEATAASYFLALPLVVGGSVHFPGPGLRGNVLQGDVAFADVLRSAGLALGDSIERPSTGADERLASIAANRPGGTDATYRAPSPRNGVSRDFGEFSDTFLTLAAISPLLEGPTRISGIAHTRGQETDRVAGMARELLKLGQEVTETRDALEIRPRTLPRPDRPIEIETYGDHRFAMSFAILGCHDRRGDGRPWIAIRDPGCCAKTFPDFFAVLESLRQKSLTD